MTGTTFHYRSPLWLPGGNVQTIWPALYSRRARGAPPDYRRERWDTPDGDFVDVDFQLVAESAAKAPAATSVGATPLLVLFHGLEGSSRSHYAEAFAGYAREHGMAFAVPHFRGCSGKVNRAPRAYHSGDFPKRSDGSCSACVLSTMGRCWPSAFRSEAMR